MNRYLGILLPRDDWQRGDLFEAYVVAAIEAEAREAVAQHLERTNGRDVIVAAWLDPSQSTFELVAELRKAPYVEGTRVHHPTRDPADQQPPREQQEAPS